MPDTLVPNLLGVVDKRHKHNDAETRLGSGQTIFTGNAAGTTTTLVGANAAPGTDDTNVIRRDEKFLLFNSSGALKEETVFRVTAIAVAVSTTVTFTPAAAAATASGDVAKKVSLDDYQDLDELDRRLLAVSGTSYSADRLRQMTYNDKIFALRQEQDRLGLNY